MKKRAWLDRLDKRNNPSRDVRRNQEEQKQQRRKKNKFDNKNQVTDASFNFNSASTVVSLMRNLKTTTTARGNVSAVLMLTSFSFFFSKELTMLSCFFSPHFLFFFTSLPMTPFPFLFVRLLLSSHLFCIQPQTPHGICPLPSLSFSLQSGVLPLAARVFGLQ